MVRGFAVSIFKEPAKMESGKISFIGDLLQVDILSIVAVDEQFGLHDAPIKIQPGVMLRFYVLTDHMDNESNISDNAG